MIRHIASNAITLLIVALTLVGGVIAWGAAQMDKPGAFNEDMVFEVKAGDRLQAVSRRLEAGGVISNGTIFRIAARSSGNDRRLKFGEYKIPAFASMNEVLGLITSGRALAYQVTIPEGLTSFQIVTMLMDEPLLSGEITEIPPEGSLAPDTYSISKGDSRASLIRRMTLAQHKIITEAWALRAEGLPLESPDEALTLASIVEKETGMNDERALVASVFINRLNRGMKLQTDPTVIYGVTKGKGSLGRGLRQSELRTRTDWNTYVIDGLPATPIANPGKASIEAALNPVSSNYVFFVADGSGGHVFAETIGEHNRNVRAWRRIEAKKRAEKRSN
ncbi:MAG: endolytic transglycosylase MltG [Paracoccaceae bacterium]